MNIIHNISNNIRKNISSIIKITNNIILLLWLSSCGSKAIYHKNNDCLKTSFIKIKLDISDSKSDIIFKDELTNLLQKDTSYDVIESLVTKYADNVFLLKVNLSTDSSDNVMSIKGHGIRSAQFIKTDYELYQVSNSNIKLVASGKTTDTSSYSSNYHAFAIDTQGDYTGRLLSKAAAKNIFNKVNLHLYKNVCVKKN